MVDIIIIIIMMHHYLLEIHSYHSLLVCELLKSMVL